MDAPFASRRVSTAPPPRLQLRAAGSPSLSRPQCFACSSRIATPYCGKTTGVTSFFSSSDFIPLGNFASWLSPLKLISTNALESFVPLVGTSFFLQRVILFHASPSASTRYPGSRQGISALSSSTRCPPFFTYSNKLCAVLRYQKYKSGATTSLYSSSETSGLTISIHCASFRSAAVFAVTCGSHRTVRPVAVLHSLPISFHLRSVWIFLCQPCGWPPVGVPAPPPCDDASSQLLKTLNTTADSARLPRSTNTFASADSFLETT